MEIVPLFTQDIESILENIRVNCSILTEYHRKDFLKLNKSIKYYRIPVLLLSSIGSIWSIAGTTFLQQHTVSLINCLLGLISAFITSIELFEKINEKMKLAEELSHKYYTLSADIFKTLSLKIENRDIKGKQYLMEIFTDYLKLCEKSNILDKKINDQLVPITKQILIKNNSQNSFFSLSNPPPNTPTSSINSSNEENIFIP
jgi:hypothetical protein